MYHFTLLYKSYIIWPRELLEILLRAIIGLWITVKVNIIYIRNNLLCDSHRKEGGRQGEKKKIPEIRKEIDHKHVICARSSGILSYNYRVPLIPYLIIPLANVISAAILLNALDYSKRIPCIYHHRIRYQWYNSNTCTLSTFRWFIYSHHLSCVEFSL